MFRISSPFAYKKKLLLLLFWVNLSQVIEFVQFKERLQHSNQYLMARLEAPILQLKLNANNIEEEEVLLFSETLWSKCYTVYIALLMESIIDITYFYLHFLLVYS